MKGLRNYGKMTELLNSFLDEINIYSKGFGFQDLYNYAEEALIPILSITFNRQFKEGLLKEIQRSDNKELTLLYVNYFVKPSKR